MLYPVKTSNNLFKTNNKIVTYSLAFVLLTLSTTSLKSQEPENKQETIQVVGDKKQENQTILNDEYNVNLNNKTPNQILNEIRLIPSVNISSSPSQPSYVSINGLKTNHTLLLINDLPIFDQTSPNAVTNFNNLGLSNFSSFSVYKGSQSGYYGNSAIAGVINLKTNLYQRNTSGSTTFNYGNNNSFYTNAKISLGTGNVSTYLATSYKDTKGYNLAKEGSERDGIESKDAVFNIAYDFNENLSLELFSMAKQYVANYDDWDYIANNSLDCLSCKQDSLSNFNYIKLNQDFANYEGYLALFNNYNNNKYYENTLGQWYDANFDPYKTQSNTLSAKYKGSVNYSYFTTTFGAEGHETTQTDLKDSMVYYTLFLGQEFKANKLISDFNISFTNSNYAVKDYIAYDFKTAYLITQNTSVFINAGKSFRMPSVNELFSSYGGNENLVTEEAKSVNSGFKTNLFNTKNYLQTSLFYSVVDNQIIYSQNKYQNIDSKYYAKGVDGVLRLLPYNFIGFTLSYSYTDAKDNQSDNKKVHGIPAHRLGLATDFSYKNVTTDVALFYNSEIYDIINNATLPYYIDTYVSINYKNPASYFSYYIQINNALNNTKDLVYGYNNAGRKIIAGVMANF